MKRFFCHKCKRVRRQRRWPVDVVNEHAKKPEDRMGTCDFHLVATMPEQSNGRINRVIRKLTPWR
jgi:hypothetical protein